MQQVVSREVYQATTRYHSASMISHTTTALFTRQTYRPFEYGPTTPSHRPPFLWRELAVPEPGKAQQVPRLYTPALSRSTGTLFLRNTSRQTESTRSIRILLTPSRTKFATPKVVLRVLGYSLNSFIPTASATIGELTQCTLLS